MAQQSGKSRKIATVLCMKHGREWKGQPTYKYVTVGIPKGKNARRFGGCPICKSEL